jgi:aerobic-type carbon monoxide dehydrogenase small subunit (CoxS/CutS family)
MVEKLQRQPVKRSELEQEIETALGQHICRCTGYVRYYQAAKAVVEELGLVREG